MMRFKQILLANAERQGDDDCANYDDDILF